MDWQSTLVGFGSGLALAALTALVTAWVTRREDRRKLKQAAQFEIYMKLMEVDSLYFWVTVWELHKEAKDPEIMAKLRTLSWQIADKLREFDDVEHMDEILNILLGETFPSAKDRADAMSALLAKLGSLVNPRYAKAIAAISSHNLRVNAFGPREARNAPGRLHP